jgi:hypothetical protein
MSISQATHELAAAFDSGDDARIDAALDNHPRTASALERIHRDAVCGGQRLGADAARFEGQGTGWIEEQREDPERWDGLG